MLEWMVQDEQKSDEKFEIVYLNFMDYIVNRK